MNIIEAIKTRRSVRKYNVSKDVDDNLIKEIITCAAWAPSAHNKQPWRFIVFRDSIKKQKIAERSKWAKFFEHAPIGIIVLTNFSLCREDKGEKSLKYFCLQDSAAAIENLLLAAWNYGLGTCWIGDFDEDQLVEMFGISDDWIPVGIISIGYPHEQWKGYSTPRKDLKEIVEFFD